MKQLKSWFFSTVRGLNSRGKFINLADFGEPDQITFTDLLDTTLTKKIDASNYQDQASPADITSKLDGDKFVNPASLPDVQLGLGSIMSLGISSPSTSTPRRVYTIDAPIADNTDIDNRVNNKFTTPENMPVVEADPAPGNTTVVNYVTSGGVTVYSIFTPLPSDLTTLDAILFVDPNGNDGTAEVGNILKPFLTIDQAKFTAVAGQTIYVFPGIYFVNTSINKNGVSYYFSPGAKVNSNFPSGMFSDGGITSTCIVRGFAELTQLHISGKIANIEGANSVFDLQCKSILDNRNAGIGADRGSLRCIGTAKIILRDCESFRTPLALPILCDTGGTVEVYRTRIYGEYDCCAEVRRGANGYFYNCFLKNTDAVNNTPVVGIGVTFPGAAATVELHDCILQNFGTGTAILNNTIVPGSQNVIFKGTNILVVNTNLYTISAVEVQNWQNLGKIFRNKITDPAFAVSLLYGDDVVNAGITYNIT